VKKIGKESCLFGTKGLTKNFEIPIPALRFAGMNLTCQLSVMPGRERIASIWADSGPSLQMRNLNRGREQADIRFELEIKNAALHPRSASGPYC